MPHYLKVNAETSPYYPEPEAQVIDGWTMSDIKRIFGCKEEISLDTF